MAAQGVGRLDIAALHATRYEPLGETQGAAEGATVAKAPMKQIPAEASCAACSRWFILFIY